MSHFWNDQNIFFNYLDLDYVNYTEEYKYEKKYFDFFEIHGRKELRYHIIGFLISFMKSVSEIKKQFLF